LDPQSPHPYHLSAFIRRWCGEFDAAAADAKRSLAFDPSEVLTQGLYATALAGQGDYPNAIAIYSNVLEVHPSSETTRQARCDAYVGSGEFHLALHDLEQMHRSPANLSRLGCVYSYSGDRLRAMTVLSQLQRRSVSEYVEPHCLAQLHIALGNHDEALKLANHAIKAHDLKFAGMLYSPLLAQSIRDRRLRARLSGIAAYLRKARNVAG
jgi:tetratricopeptide (TPR) repeat protein